MGVRGPEHDIDPSLVRAARRGDRTALERLARAVYPGVRRWALARTGDPHDADDVTQEALIRMVRTIPSFRGDSRFTTWLYTLVRSTHLDRERRERRARARQEAGAADRPPADPAPGPLDRAVRRDEDRRVRAFLAELPRRQREVFELCEMQGLPPSEAAAVLGLAASSVRVHLLRARRTLRARFLRDAAAEAHAARREVAP